MKYRAKKAKEQPMNYDQKREVEKKIAVFLAENTATADDMFDVFQMVREYLVVRPRFPKDGYSFGMYVPDQTRDDEGIAERGGGNEPL